MTAWARIFWRERSLCCFKNVRMRHQRKTSWMTAILGQWLASCMCCSGAQCFFTKFCSNILRFSDGYILSRTLKICRTMAKLLVWLREASLTLRDHAQLIICNILKRQRIVLTGWRRQVAGQSHQIYLPERKHIYSRLNSTSAKELSSVIINPILGHPRSKTSQKWSVKLKCS